MKLFNKDLTKDEILKRVGDITQLGGLKHYEFSDGLSRGIRAVDCKTASGLDFTILIDRGLDISHCFIKGIPISWRSSTRETSPVFFENRGTEWLRTFNGGILTTCGITNIGQPCNDDGEELGLHGRISNLSAEQICAFGEWEDSSYKMCVQGKVREAKVLGNKLELTRKISAWMDRPQILIEDTVENIGWTESPHMISYHVNLGYPLVDSRTELVEKTIAVHPYNDEAGSHMDEYKKFSSPIQNFKEQIFLHDIEEDSEGNCNIALVNRDFNNGQGVGFWLAYNKANLPHLIFWRQLGEGDYVCTFEPANSLLRGRKTERELGTLKNLQPGEKISYKLEMTFFASSREFDEFRRIKKI